MKKTTRWLLPFLAGSIAFLNACTPPPPSASTEEATGGTSPAPAYAVGTEYSFARWEETLPVLALAIEGFEDAIPSYPGAGYTVVVNEVPLSEEETILAAFLTCHNVSSGALAAYEAALLEASFRLSAEGTYAFKKASATADLIVEYRSEETPLGQDLALTLYRPEFRLAEYPADFVSLLSSEAIPAMEGEAFSAHFDPAGYGSVIAYGAGEESFLAYDRELRSAGFSQGENEAAYSRYLSKDGYLRLTLLLTDDEYGEPALYLRIENRWPYLYLQATLGEDLPKLEGAAERFSYAFIGEEAILTLYYDLSSEEDYLAYSFALERAGYALSSEDTVNPSDPIQARRYEKNGAAVDVLYQRSSETIAVPVYGVAH